jgi:hypothetical protein
MKRFLNIIAVVLVTVALCMGGACVDIDEALPHYDKISTGPGQK